MRDLFALDVLPLFEEHRAADWLTEGRAAARRIGIAKGEATINDVREVCPPPAGIDPRAMGAVFRTPDWESVGYQRSNRATCHNRPICIFRFKGEPHGTETRLG
jgi:extradiol dioxygenase family protein